MEITRRTVTDGVVLELAGELALGASEELRRVVDDCIGEGHRTIVLDFERVSRVDSAGLGEIVRAHTAASRHGRSVRAQGLNEELERLLVPIRMFPAASGQGRDSRAAHPRDIIWMVWVAVVAIIVVSLVALIWF